MLGITNSVKNVEETTILSYTGADLPSSLTLENNFEYRFKPAATEGAISALELLLPTEINDNYISSLVFKSGDVATSLVYPESIVCSGDDVSDNTFVPVENSVYNVLFFYDGFNVNGLVKKMQ